MGLAFSNYRQFSKIPLHCAGLSADIQNIIT